MIERGTFNGHAAIYLANDRLRIGVLPEKGSDIFEFSYKPRGGGASVQFLMQTPWGLKPPGDEPPSDFLENYEGGWQELFPNANDGCEYRGRQIPFHGEVALERWKVDAPLPGSGESSICLSVDCRNSPFHIDKVLFLAGDGSSLIIREKITNLGTDACDFVWGHHLVLGGQFLEEGCRLEMPAQQVCTPDILYEPLTARLKPAQTSAWPYAEARDGRQVDLSYIPGPDSRSHDDVIVGGLDRGFYRVTNPRLGLAFTLNWDAAVFPWLMFWQPYGGADLPPLTGVYGVGLEPWVSRYPLAKAVEMGQARCLRGGQSLQTELIATVQQF